MSSGYFFQSLDYLGFLHNGYQCILVQYLRLNRLTIRMLKYNKDPLLFLAPIVSREGLGVIGRL